MENMQRVGISIEDGLLKQFDEFIEKQEYANRSEALRDLIREKLMADKLDNPRTKAIAGIFGFV